MRIVGWTAGVLVALAIGGGQAGPRAAAGAALARGGERARLPAPASLARRDVAFLENRGQLAGPATYYVNARNMAVYFAPGGITYSLRDGSRRSGKRWTVKADFVGANPASRPVGVDPAPGIASFFRGPREQWHVGVHSFREVEYRELWPGVDARFCGTADRIKCEFVVHAGADASRIEIAYRGATVRVGDRGELHVETPIASFDDEAPVAWQQGKERRTTVHVTYAIPEPSAGGGAVVGFTLGAFDAARDLVLDPCTFAYCGFLGGSGEDDAYGIAGDAQGNAYVVGQTDSTSATFPLLAGPDLTRNDTTPEDFDAFVAKLDPDGAIVYCGYIGGDGNNSANAVAVDGSGNAYVCGTAESLAATFPVTVGPALVKGDADTSSTDGFVAKVNAAGTSLAYCGYLGGDGSDILYSIACDKAGGAYVAGSSSSTDFPRAGGRLATANDSPAALTGVVARIRVDGTGLVWSGYFGGTGSDGEECTTIALDVSGNAYVAGYTSSTESQGFPVVGGPSLHYGGGLYDAFVAKFDSNGLVVKCGYIGGNDDEGASGVAVDAQGRVYVVGDTRSDETSFPVVRGPNVKFGGENDGFVAGVKADFSGLDFCGYVGGESFDFGAACAVDAAGNLRFCGYGDSITKAVAPRGSPSFARSNSICEGFYGTVTPGTGELTQFSYLHDDMECEAFAVATSVDGSVFVAGSHAGDAGAASGVPVAGSIDRTPNGDYDCLVLAIPGIPAAPTLTSVVATGATSVDVTFEDNSTNERGFTVERTSPDGGTSATIPRPAHEGTGTVVYRDTGVFPDTTYVYRVAAEGVCQTSAFTTTLFVTTKTTMTVSVTKGSLTDAAKKRKDKYAATGTFAFTSESPDGRFDRTTDAVRLLLGATSAPFAVDIPAGSPGWKADKKGVLTWKSPRRVASKVKFVVDPAARTFSVSARKFNFPDAQVNPIAFVFKAGNDAGRDEKPWRTLPKGRFVTP